MKIVFSALFVACSLVVLSGGCTGSNEIREPNKGNFKAGGVDSASASPTASSESQSIAVD